MTRKEEHGCMQRYSLDKAKLTCKRNDIGNTLTIEGLPAAQNLNSAFSGFYTHLASDLGF